MPVIAGVEVWDTAIGVAVLGLDDQGMKIDDVTIRRTLNQGLLLGKPAGHPRRPNEAELRRGRQQAARYRRCRSEPQRRLLRRYRGVRGAG